MLLTYLSLINLYSLFVLFDRFEKLDITPKSAQKIKPVLERWMKEAEERLVFYLFINYVIYTYLSVSGVRELSCTGEPGRSACVSPLPCDSNGGFIQP